MKRTLIYPFILAALVGSIGCSSIKLQRADEAYSTLAYAKAIKHYNEGLKWKEDREARLKLAHSYMQVNDPVNAELNYRKAIEAPGTEPVHWLNFAKVLMENEKHEEAMVWLRTYLDKQPNSKIAKILYESCRSITALKHTDDLYEINRIEIIGVKSAYAAAPFGKGIVFTGDDISPEAKKDPWTGNAYFNLYYLERNATDCKTPSPLKGAVNGTFHEGAATFSDNGSIMAFTRSNYHHKKNKLVKNNMDESNLKIFFASRNDDNWENLEEFSFNSDDYSVGHPWLSTDGTILFFVSDMPGGYGGTDIYFSRLNAITSEKGSKWSRPKNLGAAVNTAGNEMFPWFSEKDSALYFSSDGHLSLGGLDIFMTKLTKNEWSIPQNMGAPLNSTKDDFAFVMNSDGKSGYLSSSRDNVDHLYEFRKPDPVFGLTGVIMDRELGTPVANAVINIVNEHNNKKITVKTDEFGKYMVMLERNATYRMDAGATEYFAAFEQASTMNKTRSETIQMDFLLEKMEMNKTIVLENIFYDLNKWNIRSDAAKELDKVVDMLQQNPSMNIELGSHTDARGNDKANMELSRKRAQAAVDYIVSKGISPARLIAKGYGESQLVNKCSNGVSCSEEEHQQNRRTELKMLKPGNVASVD